ncbi:MAG: hypothetical protein M3O34_17380 [Chloroflexota bacterium]|nr:hypothetical protein [Chloroflexota bacterium]
MFVVDVIPPELQRIVEFLNSQMDPAEVLAVEARQFVGQGQRAMIPRVLGQTATAQQKKVTASPREVRQWDERSFLPVLEERQGREAADAGRRILQWVTERGLRLWWGRGRDQGSFYPVVDHGGTGHYTVSVWTYGRVQVEFGNMKKQAPFSGAARREELRDRLHRIHGVGIPPDGIERWPSFPLAALTDDAAMQQFLDTLDWCAEQIRAT